jgi:peptidoglycan hydrolase-like protein with peptidoglycan-binding domain
MTESLMSSLAGKRQPSPARWIGLMAAALFLGVSIGWAGATVFGSPKTALSSEKFTYVRAVKGAVGSSINLSTSVSWTPAPAANNLASGIVTTVNIQAGQEVTSGTVLYSVDMQPVTIAQGDIPSFETMSEGTVGPDVAQLQRMLSTLGYFNATATGVFSRATARAVKAWQTRLGVDATGVVKMSDIVFVPSLPARIVLDPTLVKRGASVAGGEAAIASLPASPVFTIAATNDQSAFFATGTRVEITNPSGKVWQGYVAGEAVEEVSGVQVQLIGKNGVAICGDDCGSVPNEGQTLLNSKVITLETQEGITVPSSALLTEADGKVRVVDKSGRQRPVKVITSAKGISVIEGIPAGILVRIPAA